MIFLSDVRRVCSTPQDIVISAGQSVHSLDNSVPPTRQLGESPVQVTTHACSTYTVDISASMYAHFGLLEGKYYSESVQINTNSSLAVLVIMHL